MIKDVYKSTCKKSEGHNWVKWVGVSFPLYHLHELNLNSEGWKTESGRGCMWAAGILNDKPSMQCNAR